MSSWRATRLWPSNRVSPCASARAAASLSTAACSPKAPRASRSPSPATPAIRRGSGLLFAAAADSRLTHCIIEYCNSVGDHKDYYPTNCGPPPVFAPRNYHEAVVVLASHVDFDSCSFTNLPDASASAEGDAMAIISDDANHPGPASANVRNCHFIHIGQGVHTRYAYVLVEGCDFKDKHGDNDDVDLYGESIPPAIVRSNLFLYSVLRRPHQPHPLLRVDLRQHDLRQHRSRHRAARRGQPRRFQQRALWMQRRRHRRAKRLRGFDLQQHPGQLPQRHQNVRPFGPDHAALLSLRHERKGHPGSTTSFGTPPRLSTSPATRLARFTPTSPIRTSRAAPATPAWARKVSWSPAREISTSIPAFANSAATNFHLAAGSPCIDAGTNLSAWSHLILRARRVRSMATAANGPAFDLGAYEFLLPAADSNGDGIPDGWCDRFGFNPIATIPRPMTPTLTESATPGSMSRTPIRRTCSPFSNRRHRRHSAGHRCLR